MLALIAVLLQQRRELLRRTASIEELDLQISAAWTPERLFQTQETCLVSDTRSRGTFFAPMARSMTLAESAKKVSDAFEYTPQDVNTGVQEFLAQMSVFEKFFLR